MEDESGPLQRLEWNCGAILRKLEEIDKDLRSMAVWMGICQIVALGLLIVILDRVH